MKVRIEAPPCNSCGLCREVCSYSAIRPTLLEPRHLYEVIPEKCTGCGECLDYCPAPGAWCNTQHNHVVIARSTATKQSPP